jgi:monoamine oxidase
MDPVVIVGAGMAGAAAAARLGRANVPVVVIEGRERIGGRGYLKPFAGTGELLEFGGAWITPYHNRIRALVAEHGLALRPRHPVTHRRWLREGAVHDTGPTSDADRAEHERAMARIAADSLLYKTGRHDDEKGRPLTGVTFAAYLDRVNAPAATRALCSAWWTVSGNGDHAVIAASEFLSSCAYGEGHPDGMIDVWSDTVSPGMAVLAERMLAASGADVRLGSPVTAVNDTGAFVEVLTGDGHTVRASQAILAVGVNQLAAIRLSPPLDSGRQRLLAHGHGGRSFKLWIALEGVPVGTLVTGDGGGLEFAFAERAAADGATMVVAFGLSGPQNRPDDPSWVAEQAARLFPNSRMLACDGADWLGDPFSRGTWVAAPSGLEDLFDAELWKQQGRLHFASSDIARQQAGWFEGAVVSGEDAAAAVLAAA